eukprot:Hpha_TRINITY_DN7829_c1_g1::TRINITY_DN7829_c1_g1_i1::g.185711::m.185711/K00428/E1.11.1.5; cytochrome c peroxidase
MRVLPLVVLCGVAAALPSRRRVDWGKVRADLVEMLDREHDVPDGSLGPVFLRLAWHSAGTWDPNTPPCGGSVGATMRFPPENEYYDNKGLDVARQYLDRIKAKHPHASHADIWILAGYTAVEFMGGPHIEFTPGRSDFEEGKFEPTPEARLPEWNLTTDQVTAVFARMGLDQREMVALFGGHSVGFLHPENSGFLFGKWEITPLVFDNFYYKFLFDQPWYPEEYGTCGGVPCKYYINRSWIMLPTDILLRDDPKLSQYAKQYAEDEALWHRDFAAAFKKLTESGISGECPALARSLLRGGA